MSPNAITVSRSARGVTVKARGQAADHLLMTLGAGLDSRLRITPHGRYTVHFIDSGQDFLEWDVDGQPNGEGLVVACRPYQADVWVGTRVLHAPEPGRQMQIRRPGGDAASLLHAVFKVVQRVEVES